MIRDRVMNNVYDVILKNCTETPEEAILILNIKK